MGEWIKYSEKKPEEGKLVLVTIHGDVCLGKFYYAWNDWRDWFYYPEREHYDIPSAWMPLPEPYTEESDE